MIAMGWDAENIIRDMETIGDAAAATGKGEQGLQQIVTALAQIKTKGKLSTEELNQLAEAGVSAKKYIAEGLGYGSGDTGIAKMTKDLENGAIGSEKALQALLGGMMEYKGMMDKTANETVSGLWGQIEDTFEINIFRRWGQGLQDGAKQGFGSVVKQLDEADSALTGFGDTIYDVGKNISNWLADKFQNAVDRILTITDSFEFKEASLKEKVSMLWNGVIVDPLKEWWEGGGQEATAETAGEIGAWMGEAITKGLLTLFGVTDVWADSNLGESGGMSVAQSFAKGFKDNFDGSAITDAFVDAISDIWGALPTWAKVLIGGYGVGKVAGGISSLAGGVIGAVGTAKNVIGSANAMTGILGFGTSAAINLGAGNLAGGASLGAGALSALGLGATAGGIAAGVSGIHALSELQKAHYARKEGDRIESAAHMASGLTTGGGILAGAMTGAAIGSVIPGIGTAVGGFIGAGIGGIAGWFGGDKWADNIREAKYESEELKEILKDEEATSEEIAAVWEKAVWERAKGIFGDIALTTAEISSLSRRIVLGDKAEAMDTFATASKQAEASLSSLKGAVSALDRWNWKAGLGVKLTQDEQESYIEAIDEYISSAKSYLENKQYEFTASVKLLMGTGSTGEQIIKNNDAFYADLQKQVDGYSSQLQELMSSALENGKLDDVINIKIDGENFTVDEQSAIEMLQEKIANIVNSINAAEEKAQLDMIEIKFKTAGISYDSYEQLQAGIDEYKETALGNLDEAQLNVLTNLNLRLDKAQTQEEKDKIQAEINHTLESYGVSVSELNANIDSFILTLAADNFSSKDLLGEDAMAKINELLNAALKEGIEPAELTGEDITRLLGLENFDAEAAEVLAGILNNLNQWELETVVGVNITGEKNIQNTIDVLVEDFDVPEEQAATVALLLTGDKEILEKIDTTALAAELGVPKDVVETVITKLIGSKSIEERVNVLGTDLVDATEVWQTITVNLKAKVGKIVDKVKGYFGGEDGQGFRGGIFGGTSSALESFARGGMVRGGSQLIRVAEEGSPEMIIPLSAQRRDRGIELWEKAGEMLGVPGFAYGGIAGGPVSRNEGFQVTRYESDSNAGEQTVQVDVGGVHVDIHVDATGHQSISEAIREQAPEIAETVAGIFADAFESQFENTPVRGGAA